MEKKIYKPLQYWLHYWEHFSPVSVEFLLMDYCHSLYYGVDARALMRASTENSKCSCKNDQVSKEIWTPVLISLKCLYKILTLVFYLSPVCLSSKVVHYILRSKSQHLLCANKTKYKHRFDKAFSQAHPKLALNPIPQFITSDKSLPIFKVMLKISFRYKWGAFQIFSCVLCDVGFYLYVIFVCF